MEQQWKILDENETVFRTDAEFKWYGDPLVNVESKKRIINISSIWQKAKEATMVFLIALCISLAMSSYSLSTYVAAIKYHEIMNVNEK